MIYASCSTLPNRMDQLYNAVQSVLKEPKIDKLFIHYPYKCERMNVTYPEIPDWMHQDNRIVVNRCNDLGPLTKLAPMLDIVSQKEDVGLILFDDDTFYPDGWLSKLIHHFDGDAAYGRHGSLNRTFPFKNSVFNETDTLQSFRNISTKWGAIYSRRIFPKTSHDLVLFANKYKSSGLYSNDDILLGAMCFKTHTHLYLVPTTAHEKTVWLQHNPPDNDDQFSLCKTNMNQQANQIALVCEMIRNGDYGVPWPEVTLACAVISLVFLLLCVWTISFYFS